MKIIRNELTLTIECQSEIETIKVYSAVVALEIQSVERISPSPQAILSSFDSLAEYLRANQRAEQQCIEALLHYKNAS